MADILLDVKVQGAQDVVKAERALVKVQNSAKRLASEMEKGRLTSQAYFKGQTQLVQVLTKAGFSYKEARDAVFQYTKAIRSSEVAVDRAEAVYQRSAKGINRFGVLAQQSGYQIGDFIVQVQSGTNAFVAFGQQATQVAGTLTLLGGKWIFLGTALGIAIPLLTALGAAFMRTRGDTDAATTALEKFREAAEKVPEETADLAAELEALRLGFENLERAANQAMLAEATRELIKAERELAAIREPGVDGQTVQSYLNEKSVLEALVETERERVANLGSLNSAYDRTQNQLRVVSALQGDQAQEVENLREVERYRLQQAREGQKAFEESVRASAAAYREVRAEADERGVLGLISRMTAALDEVDASQEGVLNLVNMTRDAYEEVLRKVESNSQANVSALQTEAMFMQQRLQIAEMEAKEGENSVNVLAAKKRLELEILRQRLLLQVATEGITEEERAAVEQVVRLTGELIDAENAANNTANATDGITTGLSRAVNEAVLLRDTLASVGRAALSRQDQIAVLNAQIRAARAGASVPAAEAQTETALEMARGGATADQIAAAALAAGQQQATIEALEAELAGLQRPTTGGGGGETGYAGIFPELQAQVQAAMEQTRAYQEEIKLLDFALDKGMITQEGYNRAVAEAQEYYNQASDAASNYEEVLLTMANTASSAIGDAMMSIVDGTKSAKDAFSDMAQVILKKAFELAVINPILNSIFGGIPGFNMLPSIVPSANGNVFSGGNVQAFATGGVVGSPTFFPMANGGVGLMGEAGPEAIMPLKRGKGGRLGVEVSGEQGNVVINQTFAFQANGDESVKRIIASEAPKIAALTQKQMLDARRRGGVVRDTFA